MSEEQIVKSLQQNIPAPAEHTPAAPVVGDAPLTSVEMPMDELTQYKLRGFFGVYEPDQTDIDRMKHVYEEVAARIGTSEFAQVVNTLRSIEASIGATHSPRRLYTLYQWLKLDNQRTRIENEMRALT